MLTAVKQVCKESIKDTVGRTVEENDGNTNIAVAFNGSWQKCDYSSLNSVVTVTSVATSEVIDVVVLSMFCQCKNRLKNKHDDKCIGNYSGTSCGMEAEGVHQIFSRSESVYNIQYQHYLGDGDSTKAYDIIVYNEQPYGSRIQITKMECFGHVLKRMENRRRSYKKKNSKILLNDSKRIGDLGSMADAAINTIQWPRNMEKFSQRNNGNEMGNWSLYFHLGSTDNEPEHNLCSTDKNTWCKYHKSKQDVYLFKYNKHTDLPVAVLQDIKSVF